MPASKPITARAILKVEAGVTRSRSLLALQKRAAFGLGDRRADDRHLGPGEVDGGEAEHEGERCDARLTAYSSRVVP